jgi:hypothetical protein
MAANSEKPHGVMEDDLAGGKPALENLKQRNLHFGDTDYQDNEPCRFRIALKVIRVICVICEICGLKARKNQISMKICVLI